MTGSGNDYKKRREESSGDNEDFETPDLGEVLGKNQSADELNGGDRPLVPEGVLRGIEDLEEGRTVGVEEIEAALDS